MTDETEVNPLRAMMTHNIITQHPDVPLTVDALKEFFPPDFYLGPDDLAPHIRAAATTLSEMFEGELPTPKASEPTPAPAEVKAEAEPEAPLPPSPEEIERATLRRIKADQDLANCRVELIAAQGVEKSARARLAASIQTFQSGTAFAPLSPEQLRRQHIQEQAAIRQAIADGTMEAPRRGPGIGRSAVDRVAYWQKFGGGPGAGGGRAYARGAAPSSQKNGQNFNPRLGPTAKVPSQS